MNNRKAYALWASGALGLIVFAGFVQSFFGLERLRDIADTLVDFRQDMLLEAIVLYIFIYVASAALSLPIALVLSLIGGLVFGWPLGFAVVVVSATVGATIPFYWSRRFLRQRTKERFPGVVSHIDSGLEKSGDLYFLSARIAPVIPFYILNLASGVSGLRLSRYVVYTAIGIVPGTAISTYSGDQIGQGLREENLFNPGLFIGLLLLALAPIALSRFMRT